MFILHSLMLTDPTTYRRRATDLAIGGGILASLMPRWNSHVPNEVGLYKPYKYKGWHGGTEVGYKKVNKHSLHSSSSNAPMPSLPRSFPTPRTGSRGRSGSGSSMSTFRARMPSRSASRSVTQIPRGVAPQVVIPVRRLPRPKILRHGQMSGKIAPLRKIKKTRKYKLRKQGAANAVVERGKILSSATNSQAVYLGHASTPINTLLRCTWIALFNKLMAKASVTPYSPKTGVSFLSTSLIAVSYKVDGSAITQQNFQPGNGVGTVTTTAELFADWALDNIRAWNNGQTNANIEFYRMATFDSVYNPALRSNVEIRLWGTKVEYTAKSSLKMQNRTKTGTSTSTDVVDDVPLYGKAYGGKGVGPSFVNPTDTNPTFIADNQFGVIEYAPAQTENDMQEPVDPIEFARVKTAGKISIEAGQIKTSIVKDRGQMYFNTFMRQLLPRISVGQTDNANGQKTPNLTVGQYKFYGLEKVMNVDNAVNITVAYECQHNCTVSVYEKRTQIQSSYFRSSVV